MSLRMVIPVANSFASGILIVGLLLFLLLFQTTNVFAQEKYGYSVNRTKPRACMQVIQKAIDPETGECRLFPTPCEVPVSWHPVRQCPEIKTVYKNQELVTNRKSLSNTETTSWKEQITKRDYTLKIIEGSNMQIDLSY